MAGRHFTLSLILLLASVVAGARAQGPPPLSGIVRGQVVDARDGVPLRRARVSAVAGQRPIPAVFTDDEGRFSIGGVPEPTLTVQASKAGFVTTAMAVSTAGRDVRLALARGAAVMGRVLDPAGAPVSLAYVMARLIAPEGAMPPDARRRFSVQVDRLGDYRLSGLPAGRYEVTAAQIRPEARNPDVPIEEQLFGAADGLFPASSVSTLVLRPADEARNIDFAIPDGFEGCPSGPSRVPADATGSASIAGRVTGAGGEPLACAMVTIRGSGDGLPVVYSDAQGRYVIDGISPGTYIVEARRSGYLDARFGQPAPSDPEAPITLRAGDQRTGTDIALPRQNIISGRIVDEYGEPVESIRMWALQMRYIDGRVVTTSTTTGQQTDDRGYYRLTGLRPGAYIVAAMGRGAVADETPRGYASIYYPGTPDVAQAQPVTLDFGRDVDGVDFAFTPTFTALVSGTVLDVNGLPFSGTVTVSASARSGAVSVDSFTAQTDAGGAFVVRNVPPGDYAVKAHGPRGSLAPFALEYVTVRDTDPAPLALQVSAGATLEGRFVFEGAPGIDPAGLSVSLLVAQPDYAPPGAGLSLDPPTFGRNPDLTFLASGVIGPSRLLIGEMPNCPGCYLKSARVNGVEAADVPFDFGLRGGTYRDVEIVVSDAGATIEGRVTGNSSILTPSLVAVIPVDEPLRYPRSRFMKTARTAADGSFRIARLPPGDYLVSAMRLIDSIEFERGLSDPQVIQALAAAGERITVLERERRTIELRAVPQR